MVGTPPHLKAAARARAARAAAAAALAPPPPPTVSATTPAPGSPARTPLVPSVQAQATTSTVSTASSAASGPSATPACQPVTPAAPDDTATSSVPFRLAKPSVPEEDDKKPKSFPFQPFADNVVQGKKGEPVITRVNYFVVTLPKEDNVYVYDIHFAQVSPGRDVKNKALKKQLIQLLLRQPGFNQNAQHLASDYADTLVSLQRFQLPVTTHRQSLAPGSQGAPSSPQVPVYQVTLPASGSTQAQTFGIHIAATHTLLHADLDTFLFGRGQLNNSEWLNAVNILTRKHAAQHNVKVGADKFFPPGPGTTLNHGLHGRSGFFTSVRPVKDKLVLNVHGVSTGFVDSQALHLYPMAYYTGCRAAFNSGTQQRFREYDSRFKAITKGLRVRTLYNPQAPPSTVRSRIRSQPDPGSKIKRITGFGSSAASQTFIHSTHGSISVQNYFNKYVLDPATPLQLPHLLVCNLGTRDKAIYVPSELLHIVIDQSFMGPLPEGAMRLMVNVAQHTPMNNANLIEDSFNAGQMFDQKKLQASGIDIEPEMIKANARILPIPNLLYNGTSKHIGGSKNPGLRSGRWDIKGKKFRVSGSMGTLGVIEIGRGGSDLATYEDLGKAFKTYGISGDHPVEQVSAADCTSLALDNALSKFTQRPQFVLIMLPDKTTDDYESLKWWADTKAGIHTVCVTDQKKSKLKDAQKAQFQGNLALKFNMKAGGRNHTLADSEVDLLAQKGSTMVVGADVSHPGPGSVAHCPSIAAVVASTDKYAVNFPGSLRLQRSKQEMIGDLKGMIFERLKLWYQNNDKKLPNNILFYRDGVSESQFAAVLRNELPQIRSACEEAGERAKVDGYDPKITVVIGGKRHHTRFYPMENFPASMKWAIDNKNNWKAGLVVDDPEIRNPYHFDFYLQSHAALKGTARPCHYFVIHNGMKLGADDLQRITFNLCWTFAIALTPISYASPAYYADLLAERGRCYLSPYLKAGHPDRQVVEQHLMANLGITPQTTMQQIDQLVLDRIKSGWTPPNSPHVQSWVDTTDRSSPQHPDIEKTMFYI